MQAPMPPQGASSQAPQSPQSPQSGPAGAQVAQMIDTIGKGLVVLAGMFGKLGQEDKAHGIASLAAEYQNVISGKPEEEGEPLPSPKGGVSPMEAGGNPNAVPMG